LACEVIGLDIGMVTSLKYLRCWWIRIEDSGCFGIEAVAAEEVAMRLID